MENNSRLIWLALRRKVFQSINALVFSRYSIQLDWLYQFPGDTAQLIIQSDIISHASLVFILCHDYQWSSIEKSGEPPICLLDSFWSSLKQLWQTYISICSIFQALQGAAIKMFICDILKIHLTSLLIDSKRICQLTSSLRYRKVYLIGNSNIWPFICSNGYYRPRHLQVPGFLITANFLPVTIRAYKIQIAQLAGIAMTVSATTRLEAFQFWHHRQNSRWKRTLQANAGNVQECLHLCYTLYMSYSEVTTEGVPLLPSSFPWFSKLSKIKKIQTSSELFIHLAGYWKATTMDAGYAV